MNLTDIPSRCFYSTSYKPKGNHKNKLLIKALGLQLVLWLFLSFAKLYYKCMLKAQALAKALRF